MKASPYKRLALGVCISTILGTPACAQNDAAPAVASADAEVATPAQDDAAFQAWLAEFRTEALGKGIGAATLDAILPTIQQQRRVIEADRNQAEFVETYADYLERVSPRRIEMGQQLMVDHGDMIRAAAEAHGVQPRFVAAILGMESNYGTFPITEPLFNVIATLAYDGRRAEQFRAQLLAAFEIVDKGYATPEMMKSSWAGALGAPQFMPDSYLRLAVDENGDGIRDLWNMGPDVIGSVANYLKDAGWQENQTWGRVVSLPPGGEQSLPAPQNTGMPRDEVCRRYATMGAWRDLSEWQELGVRKADGTDLPTRPIEAALIIGDEGDDKGYLVYRNFCSIMRYNPSFKYALGVSLLSDAIDGIRD